MDYNVLRFLQGHGEPKYVILQLKIFQYLWNSILNEIFLILLGQASTS